MSSQSSLWRIIVAAVAPCVLAVSSCSSSSDSGDTFGGGSGAGTGGTFTPSGGSSGSGASSGGVSGGSGSSGTTGGGGSSGSSGGGGVGGSQTITCDGVAGCHGGTAGSGGGGWVSPPGDGGVTNLPGGTEACADQSTGAELTPVNLIIVYDKSSSMGNLQSSTPVDPATKWIPVNNGMKAFFQDTKSAGLSAALTFFPVDGDLAKACAGPYDQPTVAPTPLTDPAPLIYALDNTQPYGGTPTLPALKGAVAQAKQIQKLAPSSKVIIVLVTDGEPGIMVDGSFVEGCEGNNVANVVKEAADAYAADPPIPTYVIGIGMSADNLNKIAQAGGTDAAKMVSVTDPEKTKLEIQGFLDSIRSTTFSCEFDIPDPPTGRVLLTNQVNVIYETGSGAESTLPYNEGCATGGDGWTYDNKDSPTLIKLCDAACSTAQADTTAKLSIMLGCATVDIK